MSLNEVEQENFEAEEFIDRFARKSELKIRSVTEFDSISLHTVFLKAIHDLKIKKSIVEKRVKEVEADCEREEESHCARVAQLLSHNQEAFKHFNILDENISFVASKVVHLGDQLQGVNLPRTRAADAHLLMKHFSHFLLPNTTPLPALFNDPFQLQEAADVIQKLNTIVQELPENEKFTTAKTRILNKYTDIEKELIETFSISFREGNIDQMKQLAESLSHFKEGYTQSIAVFIEESQKNTLHDATIFEDTLKLVNTMSDVIPKVFTSPQNVLDKLIANVFHGKLQEHIKLKLQDRSDLQKYLQTLASLHQKTVDLAVILDSGKKGDGEKKELSGVVGEGCGGGVMKMVGRVYGGYLETYIRDEKVHLRNTSTAELTKFYEARQHLKKPVGGMSDLRRDLQQALNSTLSTLAPSQDASHPGAEVLMAAEVTLRLIELFKAAFLRCHKLSSRDSVGYNTSELFKLCLLVLLDEYVLYALDTALNALPGMDARVDGGSFLHLVQLTNSFRNLFENLFVQAVHPSLLGSSRLDELVGKRKEVYVCLEKKLELGIDRTLTGMAATIKNILSSEQKKGDFRIEYSSDHQLMASTTCGKVIGHLKSWFIFIGTRLDGKNLQSVQLELLVRFHRVLYEHILQFQYSYIGAMMLISDVNEYRRWVKEQSAAPIASQLFSLLHSLCNLLMVLPDNLNSVCTSEELKSLDKSVLLSFIQLRCDYKSAKLATFLR